MLAEMTSQKMTNNAAVLPTPVTVTLHPWQVDLAAHCGAERATRNAGRVKDTVDYTNKGCLQPELDANIATCMCELAVSVYLRQSWNGPYWSPEHPRAGRPAYDVGANIEVRRTRTLDGGEIPVKPSEASAKIDVQIVQAYVPDEVACEVVRWFYAGSSAFEYVNVVITGVISAKTAWEKSKKDPKKQKQNCSQRWLRDISTLLTQ